MPAGRNLRNMYTLGFNCLGHNAAAALVRDGEILGAVEEERFDRKKHSGVFPERSIKYLLETNGVSPAQLSAVGYYWNPYKEVFPAALHLLRYFPQSAHLLTGASFTMEFSARLPRMFTMQRHLSAFLGEKFGRGRFFYVPHHRCHAASAFFPSDFDEAAVLTMDMIGEWTTTQFSIGKNRRLDILREIKFPHSLGMIYTAVTHMLGFAPFDEWKVMGLAAYGKPRFLPFFRELIATTDDGGFRVNMDLVGYHLYGRKKMLRPEVYETLGPPREEEEELEERHADIAASLQERTTEIILHCARWLQAKSGLENLCMAGGVALNCLANGRILNETKFKNIFVQPASNDPGTALGAALWLNFRRAGGETRRKQTSVYLGPAFSSEEIESALEKFELDFERLTDVESATAELIDQGLIVGWFQGAMEFGPRALGNRSILADPRLPDMKARINRAVKFREPFRPFAASVLEEKQHEWFEKVHTSPYMTVVFPVIPDRAKSVPAIVHEDGTCRIQSVQKNVNPRYWKMIERFEERSGIPMVLNTSFNVKGEPIVCTPEDGIRCFLGCGLDCLVIGDFLVRKQKI